MSSVLAPASLQQICQAAAASWLLDWSGMIGQISARTAALRTQRKSIGEDSAAHSANYSRVVQNSASLESQWREDYESTNEVHFQGDVYKKFGSGRYRKKPRRDDRIVTVDPSVPERYVDPLISEYLGYCSHRSYDTCFRHNPRGISSCTSIQPSFDRAVLDGSVRICTSFFKQLLPPALVNQILILAWKQVSRLVCFTRHSHPSEVYQVADWVRRVPALLQLCTNFSAKGLALDISGIPNSLIEDVLVIISQYFPFKIVGSLVLPKTDFKEKQLGFTDKCTKLYNDILLSAALTSVILNSDLCNDAMLSTLSQLPLKELEIGGNSVSEKGIINGLCALPVDTISEANDIISSGHLQSFCASPLRKSLQKLEMSFQRLHSSVFHIIPAVFLELRYYNPHRNVVQCLLNFDRILPVENNNSASISSQATVNLVRLNAGNSSRATLNVMARICPHLQELVLTLDSAAEDTLTALENFPHLSRIEILYFPSLPASQPKLDANILHNVIEVFGSQLRYISMTGFSVSGSVLSDLSQLPELCNLSFNDCWLSNPKTLPCSPFPSLGKLSLNFLPANTTMQFLTMGGNVHSLHLDLKGLEWGSNPLTDSSIRDLVSFGILRSLRTFTATSSYLTTDALSLLASMPYIKSVGYLSSWGLTEEELCCVNHSGPQHVVCYQ
ncbi:uncharacterized protein LOC135216364 [Macrobrachium nipponense]|uniref:uncharacterized protein LOC135216364 n=1 Tax=Macrobrachium nipponense TaxID=159736 RepID=UPI0030C862FB